MADEPIEFNRLFLLPFALLICIAGVIALVQVIDPSPRAVASPNTPYVMLGGAVIFFGIGAPSLLIVVNERFIVSETGIRHRDWTGKIKEEISWSSVRSFRYIRHNRNATTYKLETASESLVLDTNIGRWRKLREFILSHVPSDAEVRLFKP